MDRTDNNVQGLTFTLQQQNTDRIFNTPRTVVNYKIYNDFLWPVCLVEIAVTDRIYIHKQQCLSTSIIICYTVVREIAPLL